jgi:hypothetical protein
MIGEIMIKNGNPKDMKNMVGALAANLKQVKQVTGLCGGGIILPFFLCRRFGFVSSCAIPRR